MLKITKKYTDFNGVEREEDFYFNFTKAEVTELELGVTGGLSEMVKKIVATKDVPSLMKIFKELVLKAYGVKSDDGRRFIKNDALRDEFAQTQAYSDLFMELATDDQKAADFINKVLPKVD
jgi:hypothetical protein